LLDQPTLGTMTVVPGGALLRFNPAEGQEGEQEFTTQSKMAQPQGGRPRAK
jgi:hypothetical protein